MDVNTNQVVNFSLETGDISIGANGHVLLAWEDDGGGLTDWEAIWTMYDGQGNLITPAVTITNNASSACIGAALSLPNCTYRSYFRSDGTATPSYAMSYGGKAKGNQFGDGFAWCGGGGDLASEIPELYNICADDDGGPCAGAGGSPIVQLLNNDGSPNTSAGGPDVAGILSYSDADLQPSGSVRPGDIDFLANGNFVIVGESRQSVDTNLTGQASGNVVVYKVLNMNGGVVMPYTNASSEAVGQNMWHGTAATANGFAMRFDAGGDRIRFFDNDGNPLTTNINIAAVTGHPEAGQGGRGDGTGFKSNGKDAIVYACSSSSGPWVTVFNADGTVRYSRAVTETNDITGLYADSDRLDAAIAEDGRVIVAFDASNNDTNNPYLFRLPQARVFDPAGNPMGPVFYISERENGTNALSGDPSCRPRVAWRGNTIAVLWGSGNCPDPNFLSGVVGFRLFDAEPLGPTVQLVNGNVTITWAGNGVLQESSDMVTWDDLPSATSGYSPPTPLAEKKFYRLKF
jgi:hypothetical protein